MSDGPVVGVVGPEDPAVSDAVRDAGGDPRCGPASDVVGESDAVVAVGEAALLAVGRAAPTVPVLPVDAGRGVRSVPGDAVPTAVEALLAGDYDVDGHLLYDVDHADRTTARALQDVLLVSAEPAQISEYTIRTGDERVARFRADGVVVATPAGSPGYARAAGGPVVPPGVDAVVVAAVAPFSTDVDHWTLPPEDLRIAVERDETAVQLVADDRVVGPIGPDEPVRVSPSRTVDVAVVDASRSCFDRS